MTLDAAGRVPLARVPAIPLLAMHGDPRTGSYGFFSSAGPVTRGLHMDGTCIRQFLNLTLQFLPSG